MSVTINGTSGVTFNDASNQTTAATGFGFKNRIINGAMVINQRNAGASITLSTTVSFPVDRLASFEDTDGTITAQQSSVAPAGFTNSVLLTVTVADTSLAAAQRSFVQQRIEGYNVADLGWGTASAQTITLSFWVRSSVTGTFGASFHNAAYNRSYPFSYAINAANTWEQKTVTVAGDTSGTWNTTNGIGLALIFNLGSGSNFQGTGNTWQGGEFYFPSGTTQLIGTNGATFYITGVQLEKGSTATSFDYRPYTTELQLCQRYYVNVVSGGSAIAIGFMWNTSELGSIVSVPVTMRTSPSLVQTTGTAYYAFERSAGNQTFSSFVNIVRWASQQGYLYASSSGTTGHVGELRGYNAASYVAFSSEL